jgi:hypothetical protein
MRRMRHPRKRQIAEIVTESCRLVHSMAGVRAVHIVAQRRPTYAEMHRYRQEALRDHVGLSVNGQGVISIRPETQ